MLFYAAVFFALAALGGLAMFGMRLAGKPLPLALGFGHGILAAAGLVALIVEVLQSGAGGLLGISLVLFVLAALGGFVLFAWHLRGKVQPIGVMLMHGLIAVIAFALLLVYMMRTAG